MTYQAYLDALAQVTNSIASLVTSTFDTLMDNPVTGVPVIVMVIGMVITIVVRVMQGLIGTSGKEV